MYTIEDLRFAPVDWARETDEAKVKLKNGYTVKVLRGKGAVHTYGAPYEASITPITRETTEDSIGYLSEEQLIQLINEVASYPKLKGYS